MDSFVAMLLGALYEVDQSGKCALVIQQFIRPIVTLCIGEEKDCRYQDNIGLVILRGYLALETQNDLFTYLY